MIPTCSPPAHKWKDERVAKLKTIERKGDGNRLRYCKHCKIFKPDRAHHCRKTGACVLQMQSYVPWFDCTVDVRNVKLFYLAQIYFVLINGSVSFLSARHLVRKSSYEISDLHSALVCIVCSVPACFVAMMFVRFNLMCSLKGYTLIEYMEKPYSKQGSMWKASSPYDTGLFRNLQTVFGPIPLFWPLPVNLPRVIEYYYPDSCNMEHPFVSRLKGEIEDKKKK